MNTESLANTTPSYESPLWAAQLMGKSIRTLANWRSKGFGPKYIKIGHSIFYSRSDVYSFMESHKRGGSL